MRYTRTGSGRTLVLLHTLRTQLEYFDGLIAQLDTARFDAIALDLPGHGRSTAPRVAYTAAYFTDAVAGALDALDLQDAVVAGDSIGGAIALGLAARHHPRVGAVVAINPYDYGHLGGVRRSSPTANAVFTTMQWPLIGPIVARSGFQPILRRIVLGGLHDRSKLPPPLLDELLRCGALPGHARALRSLAREWQTWIDARAAYERIALPVSLVYGPDDWSRPAEREADAELIPGARTVTIERCGHFASLERPQEVAALLAAAA